jgi:formylglycine-generating enzyme required for sulfatase activity/uncharacterized caspase-like protein
MNKGRRYAVLIGSSRFDKEPNLNSLKCPENDVDGMREVLAAVDLGAFDEPSVFKNADSTAVMHRIEEILSEATGADQVLIYYSGHGKTDLPGRLYLATANTEIKKLVTTSIPIETLRLLIENSSCRKVMLILDCCYGGAVGKSFTRGDVDDRFKELARGNGVYILTASTASQTALEREGDDYGLLTKHIISGINQGAADADDDGLVSMDDLYRYVYAKVKSEGYQEPMRWALNVKGEDLIIARASGVSIREQQRLLTDKVIEIRPFLPSRIFTRAIQVIEERRGQFYEIVSRLHREQWQVGRFIEEWDLVESGERPQPPSQREEASKAEVVERKPRPEAQSHEPQSQPVAPPPQSPPQPQVTPKTEDAGRTGQMEKSAPTPGPKPQPAPAGQGDSTAGRPRPAGLQGEPEIASMIVRWRQSLGGLAAVVGIAMVIWITTAPPELTPSVSLPALSSAEFETVTLNNQGEEVDRRKLQAEYFTEDLNGVPLEMVKIPGGTFTMGSPNSEVERYPNEGPQRSVTVPEFFIGRFEVTREQWRQVAKVPRAKIDLKEDPSYFKDSLKQPVEQVSWEEAVEFCNRLEKKTGKPYRLPSEAEWEYGARAGMNTPFAFGSTITPKIVNYNGNYPYGSAPKDAYRQKTVEAGSLGVANAFGLSDMHGNVWEWCEDVWHDGYKGAPNDGSAWLSGGDSTRRVLRGGSWHQNGGFSRSANRDKEGAGDRYYSYGFRVAVAARTK